jgi:hypothetical protein
MKEKRTLELGATEGRSDVGFGFGYLSARGSSASRRASPTKLKARTTSTRDPAEIKKKLGITVTKRVALDSRMPHVDAGG